MKRRGWNFLPPTIISSFYFSTFSAGLLDLGHVMAGKPVGDHVHEFAWFEVLRFFFCVCVVSHSNIKSSTVVDGRGPEMIVASSRFDDTPTAGS